MATCTENKTAVDALIVAMYPEVRIDSGSAATDPSSSNLATDTLEATMDVLATHGRLSYTITLIDSEHGPALTAYIKEQLTSTGYSVNKEVDSVVITCS